MSPEGRPPCSTEVKFSATETHFFLFLPSIVASPLATPGVKRHRGETALTAGAPPDCEAT